MIFRCLYGKWTNLRAFILLKRKQEKRDYCPSLKASRCFWRLTVVLFCNCRGVFLQLPWCFLMLTASSCFEVCVLLLHKCCIYTVFMHVYCVYICKNLYRMIWWFRRSVSWKWFLSSKWKLKALYGFHFVMVSPVL